MPEKSPRLYDLKKTTVWFAVAGVILFVSLIAMILQDSIREWKGWQRKFMALNKTRAEEELKNVEKSIDQKKLEEWTKTLESAGAAEKSHQAEIKKLNQELAHLEVRLTKAKTRFQDIKQLQDSDRFFFEEYRAHGPESRAAAYGKRIDQREPQFAQAKLDQEGVEAAIEEKNKALEQLTTEAQKASQEIARMTQDIPRLKNKIGKNSFGIVQAILNAPMLDFLKPSLQIQQIVLEHLEDDFYFAKSKKVDRCVTCHLGIDQKGYETAEQPFKSHPRLELFLAADSPHPAEKFGCTVCHGGSGHSASFVTAAHTPRNEKQAEEWRRKYHWKPLKHWGEKMLPLQHMEASCAKCHQGSVYVPEAPKLNKGRKLAEEFGCFNCHKVAGFERWKNGPGLLNVQSKLEADWIVRWLQNPKEFRASTKMPRIFHLSNTSDPESMEKNNATIAGIAAYLMKNSDAVSLESPKQEGKPENGEKLVRSIGCTGCHTAGDLKANDFGPELSGLGSKVKKEWLYTWLKNPKHYFSETRMPDLKLTEEEAADITAYLLTLKNEKFDSIRPPLVKPETVDALARAFMSGKMRQMEIDEKIGKMPAEDKLEFVGKQSIAHQGCFGCHAIKGFENTKQIGTELTEEGSKDVHKFYFGFVPIDHTREAWIYQKLKEPRIFDQGKVVSYHEKLRMPQFDFTDEQAEALTTFVLSLQKAEIPLEMQKRLSEHEQQIETGRLNVAKFNCQGCHTLDGKDGAIRSITEDPGNAPPILDGEGKKVKPEWLYQFLHAPPAIRPWLKYRMPTFGFTPEQINQLIAYFNHLDKVPADYAGAHTLETNGDLGDGKKLFEMFQCIKCHKSNPEPGLTASFLAPDLAITKQRLRPDWVIEWLKDPQAIQPGTMMPGFFPDGQSPAPDFLGGDYLKQIKAIRDYLWVFEPPVAVSTDAANKPAA